MYHIYNYIINLFVFDNNTCILELVVTFKLNFDVDAILLPKGFNLEPVLCIFLPRIMVGGGTKFLNCIFYQKMLKNMSIFKCFPCC